MAVQVSNSKLPMGRGNQLGLCSFPPVSSIVVTLLGKTWYLVKLNKTTCFIKAAILHFPPWGEQLPFSLSSFRQFHPDTALPSNPVLALPTGQAYLPTQNHPCRVTIDLGEDTPALLVHDSYELWVLYTGHLTQRAPLGSVRFMLSTG